MPRSPTIPNEASVLLAQHLTELGLKFEQEFLFHPKRKWRFDFVLRIPLANWHRGIAVEIEGAIFTQGRHTRGKGYAADMVKYREATRLLWDVYRFSTQEVLNGTARAFIAEHCLWKGE